MWTRGRDKNEAGKFAFELFTDSGVLVERVGGFATHTEASRAAEAAQRRLTFADVRKAEAPRDYFDAIEADMSDDELLAALAE